MNSITVALIVAIAIVIIYFLVKWLGGSAGEGFVSKNAQAVCDSSRELFERTGGRATFSEYKTAVPTAEAVLYTDTRDLWRKGSLTPENVQKVM